MVHPAPFKAVFACLGLVLMAALNASAETQTRFIDVSSANAALYGNTNYTIQLCTDDKLSFLWTNPSDPQNLCEMKEASCDPSKISQCFTAGRPACEGSEYGTQGFTVRSAGIRYFASMRVNASTGLTACASKNLRFTVQVVDCDGSRNPVAGSSVVPNVWANQTNQVDAASCTACDPAQFACCANKTISLCNIATKCTSSWTSGACPTSTTTTPGSSATACSITPATYCCNNKEVANECEAKIACPNGSYQIGACKSTSTYPGKGRGGGSTGGSTGGVSACNATAAPYCCNGRQYNSSCEALAAPGCTQSSLSSGYCCNSALRGPYCANGNQQFNSQCEAYKLFSPAVVKAGYCCDATQGKPFCANGNILFMSQCDAYKSYAPSRVTAGYCCSNAAKKYCAKSIYQFDSQCAAYKEYNPDVVKAGYCCDDTPYQPYCANGVQKYSHCDALSVTTPDKVVAGYCCSNATAAYCVNGAQQVMSQCAAFKLATPASVTAGYCCNSTDTQQYCCKNTNKQYQGQCAAYQACTPTNAVAGSCSTAGGSSTTCNPIASPGQKYCCNNVQYSNECAAKAACPSGNYTNSRCSYTRGL